MVSTAVVTVAPVSLAGQRSPCFVYVRVFTIYVLRKGGGGWGERPMKKQDISTVCTFISPNRLLVW